MCAEAAWGWHWPEIPRLEPKGRRHNLKFPLLRWRQIASDCRGGTDGHFCFPREDTQPTLDVTGGADELDLQVELGFAAIARLAQAVRSHQFTLGALNSVARVHPLAKCVGLLLASALLQQGVVLAHHQRAVLLSIAHTTPAQ